MIKRYKQMIKFDDELNEFEEFDCYPVLQEDIKGYLVKYEDVKEAITFFEHLKNHTEVKNDLLFPNQPICKICGKSANQILTEEKEGE